jgi:hypothetical protein
MEDYLARGRRFAKLDVERLNKDWIIAVRSWLAHKHRIKERMMDDLAAELRLRGLEPPYGAVEQQLADRSAQSERGRALANRRCDNSVGNVANQLSGWGTDRQSRLFNWTARSPPEGTTVSRRTRALGFPALQPAKQRPASPWGRPESF